MHKQISILMSVFIYTLTLNNGKSFDPANYPPGKLVPIQEIDSSGRTITRYVGDPAVWLAPFMRGGYSGRINDPRQ